MSRSDSQRLVSRRSWSPSRRDYLRRAAVSLRRRRRSSLCLRRLGLLGRSSIRRVSEEAAGPPRFLRCLFRNVSMAKGPGGIAASLPNAAHDDVAFRSAQVRQLPQMYISGRTHQPAPSLSTLRRRGHPRQRKTRYRSAGLSLDRAGLSPARHQSLISELHRFSFLQGQACPGALCTSSGFPAKAAFISFSIMAARPRLDSGPEGHIKGVQQSIRFVVGERNLRPPRRARRRRRLRIPRR